MKRNGRREHILVKEDRNRFIDFVIDHVCDFEFVDREDLLCGPAKEEFVLPRQMVMFAVKTLRKDLSLKEIGKNLNLQDHGTISYGIERMQNIYNNKYLHPIMHKKLVELMKTIETKMYSVISEKESIGTMIDQEAEDILRDVYGVEEVKLDLREVEE